MIISIKYKKNMKSLMPKKSFVLLGERRTTQLNGESIRHHHRWTEFTTEEPTSKKQEEMKRNALLLFLWALALVTNVNCASKSREKRNSRILSLFSLDPYIVLKLLVLKN